MVVYYYYLLYLATRILYIRFACGVMNVRVGIPTARNLPILYYTYLLMYVIHGDIDITTTKLSKL